MPGGSITVAAIAELVGGEVRGHGEVAVSGVAPLEEAGPAHLSFLTSPRYVPAFCGSGAGAVLLPPALSATVDGPATRIVVADPAVAMATVVAALYPEPPRVPAIDPTVRLGPGVQLGEGVVLEAHVVLGPGVVLGDRVIIGAGSVLEAGVCVGDDTLLGPHVTCSVGTVIGRRCRIKAGAVLGGAGFGYVPGASGHRRVPHVGRCRIEDDVDIGANTCVDRGSIGDTVIGAGTRVDNLVQIGHNVRIGRRCLLMAQVGIAGSTRIGDEVILAGQVGVAGHLEVGDRARVAAQAGVASDLPGGEDYGGSPARPHREWLRSTAVLYGLAPLARDLKAVVAERRAHA